MAPEPPISEIPSQYVNANDLQKSFSIDDMIDVWCRGVTNGATLWQYCQDHEKQLPSSFELGLIGLIDDVRNSTDKTKALEALINNNMILLGVFDEKINTSL